MREAKGIILIKLEGTKNSVQEFTSLVTKYPSNLCTKIVWHV